MSQEGIKKVSYITEGTRIKGDVVTSSALIVKGFVEGNVISTDDVEIRGTVTGGIQARNVNIAGCDINGDVTCAGNLYVDPASSICGNIQANQIKVSGSVKGKINVKTTAEFLSNSYVIGDVNATSIAIEHGAKIKGFINIVDEEVAVVEEIAPQEEEIIEPIIEEVAPVVESAKEEAIPEEKAVEEDSDDALFEEII